MPARSCGAVVQGLADSCHTQPPRLTRLERKLLGDPVFPTWLCMQEAGREGSTTCLPRTFKKHGESSGEGAAIQALAAALARHLQPFC